MVHESRRVSVTVLIVCRIISFTRPKSFSDIMCESLRKENVGTIGKVFSYKCGFSHSIANILFDGVFDGR